MKSSPLVAALLAFQIAPLPAVDNVTVKALIADTVTAANSALTPVDLRNHFEVMGVDGTVVRFATNLGTFNVLMFDSISPNTVTNFLRYVNEARYSNSIIHRSQAAVDYERIIQGGEFLADTVLSEVTPLTGCNTIAGSTTVTCASTAQAAAGMTVAGSPLQPGTTITSITNATTFVISPAAATTASVQRFTVAHPPIPMETSNMELNARGRIAMARGAGVDSATKGWFINVGNNSLNFLPASAGGYAAFGRVMGAGMTVVDAIGALPVFTDFGFPFLIPYVGTLPGGGTINLANLVRVNTMTSGPVFPTANGQTSYVGFSLANTNPSLVPAAFNGSTLNLPLTPNRGGIAKVRVTATDGDGMSVVVPFSITVTGGSTTNSDLSGDVIDDIILQNNAGQILGWRLNANGTVASGFWLYTGALGDWRVVETVDINGDGFTDLIFQNNVGQVLAFLMNGSGGLVTGIWLFPAGLGDWRVVGVADVDRDGTPDIVLQNSAGLLLARLTDGKGIPTGWAWVSLATLGDWRVVGITDMNRDSINDIVFQNTVGQILVWLLDGSGTAVNFATGAGLKPGSGYLYAAGLGTWRVAALIDVNRDGIPDVIFQGPYGHILAWLLDGTATPVNLSTGAGLKPGSGYIYNGALGDWRVR